MLSINKADLRTTVELYLLHVRRLTRRGSTVDALHSPLEVAYDDNVYNANDVGLKAHFYRGDINEVSRQFIDVLVCQFNSL